eukprot:TRINITY_DN352_c0_g1_i1.p1 TRINITY_DN352_c0_g1~~TRINITY_DN352_c0_g1_i1.p1  ORF type:complete len:394 (+),score=153.39 TRINITY_DN352_c0_g1_i1:144-1325(+)
MCIRDRSKVQIYVSNLPAQVSNDRLKAAFLKFGTITDNFVPQRKRFGFVTFENEADMNKALSMDGQQLDEEAAAAGAEVLKITVAREKPAAPEGEQAKKKPAAKKQQAKKEPKKAPAAAKGAKAEGGKRGAKKAEPRPKQQTVESRKANYNAEISAKCLLLGYANRVAEREVANYDESKAREGFPGLDWVKAALTESGLQKSLFYKAHKATYSSGEDGESWAVSIEGLEGDDGKQNFAWKNTDACPEHAATFDQLRRDLLNEAKSSMTLDDEEIAMNRAKIFLLNKLSAVGKAAAAPKPAAPAAAAPVKAAAPKPKASGLAEGEEFDLEKQRAAARAKAAAFAASLTPEEQAIYGAKVQVAASGVRQDSDSDSEGGADFAVGGEDDGMMLGDY